MIRQATPKDREDCFNLAKKLYGKFMFEHGVALMEEDLFKTVDLFIENGQNLVVEQDGKVCGMCAWLVTGHPANFKCKIFQEVLWCMESKYKTDALLLLRALERKANESGAEVVVLANLALDNEKALGRIYGKLGYEFMESHYSRTNRIGRLV